jgi:hypothetical protein
VAVSIGSFIQASGRTWPSKRILSGVGELRRRGGGGNLGVRRTLPVRSGLMGSAVAGFQGLALVTDREPSRRHNEALKLSRRFAPRSLTPVRYAAVGVQWVKRACSWGRVAFCQRTGAAVMLEAPE